MRMARWRGQVRTTDLDKLRGGFKQLRHGGGV
jgi:hypothetical protein